MTNSYTDTKIDHCLRTGEAAGDLRALFGSTLYETLREEVRRPPVAFSESARPKAYILPGILGSSLEVKNWFFHDLVWVDPLELLIGGIRRLRLSPDDGVRPRGALKLAYERMKLRLDRLGMDVVELPYDWRKSTMAEAHRLMERLRSENSAPVTLIGHSMGGLVARGLASLDPDGAVIGKVITIGTPNLGSFAPVQVFTLAHGSLETFQKLDQFHSAEDLARKYMRHFPGLVEMMPGDGHGPIDFFNRAAWPSLGTVPTAQVLSEAYANKTSLPSPDHRFTQIISIGEATTVDATLSGGEILYQESRDGDGTVPRVLAELGQVQRYYTHGSHPWLCNQAYIIDAVRDLVLTGQISDTTNFSTNPDLADMPDASPELLVMDGWGPDTLSNEAMLLDSFGKTASKAKASAAEQASRSFVHPVVSEKIETEFDHDVGPHGYVLDHVAEAGQAWRSAAAERAEIERHVAKGTSTLAETPERLAKYERRIMDALGPDAPPIMGMAERMPLDADVETISTIDNLLRERIIGSAEEFLSVDFLKRGRFALNPVCRIVQLSGSRGFGSGFLVAPDVVMTNNHVLRSEADASGSGAEFEFERDARSKDLAGRVVEFDPSRLFVTNVELDFTLVALKESLDPPHRKYGFLPLIGEEGKIRVTRPVNIIQHPDARRKEVIMRESILKVFPPSRLAFAHYTGDTLPGSSGSPVFNDRWEVVALHHSGVPEVDALGRILNKDGARWSRASDPRGKTINWIANEGVRISRIMPVVAEAARDFGRPSSHRELLGAVIDAGARASVEGAFYWLDDGIGDEARTSGDRNDDPAPQASAPPASSGFGSDISLPMSFTINLTPARGGRGGVAGAVEAVRPEDFAERRRISDYDDRAGYDPDFLGRHAPFPRPTRAIRPDVATLNGSLEIELKYDTFSVLMSRRRRLAIVSGGNYDPDARFHASRRDPWAFDPRLPRSLQAGNDHYRNNPLDRGHLFRAEEGAWGHSIEAAQRASDDTFHWTNIAPQHEIFNQTRRDTRSIWGKIENHLIQQAKEGGGRRMTTFNGPIFQSDDLEYQGLKVPASYWKVAVMRDGGGLRALAFILGQESLISQLETLQAGRFGIFQVPLSEIEALTGLDFGSLHEADAIAGSSGRESLADDAPLRWIESIDQILP